MIRHFQAKCARYWNLYVIECIDRNHILHIDCDTDQQEAFEKCWAYSPLMRAAARRLFYIAIHQVSLLSLAATVARRLRLSLIHI